MAKQRKNLDVCDLLTTTDQAEQWFPMLEEQLFDSVDLSRKKVEDALLMTFIPGRHNHLWMIEAWLYLLREAALECSVWEEEAEA